jgi:VanZ family protein
MITWFEKHSNISLIITLLIAILIFYISSLSFAPSTSTSSSIKPILYHILIFFIFSFFLSLTILKGKNKLLIIPTIIISILYAISDELHQFFVPGRNFSLIDIFLDSLGIITASLIYITILEIRKNY